MNYHTMQAMTMSHRCAVCGGPLVLPWYDYDYHLVCGQNRQHRGYERRPSLAEQCEERERQMAEKKPPLVGLKLDDLF